jgi:hypothetical protein
MRPQLPMREPICEAFLVGFATRVNTSSLRFSESLTCSDKDRGCSAAIEIDNFNERADQRGSKDCRDGSLKDFEGTSRVFSLFLKRRGAENLSLGLGSLESVERRWACHPSWPRIVRSSGEDQAKPANNTASLAISAWALCLSRFKDHSKASYPSDCNSRCRVESRTTRTGPERHTNLDLRVPGGGP